MTQQTSDDWDGFTGTNFLKTSHVANEEDGFLVEDVQITEAEEDNPSKPRLILSHGDDNYVFDLNVTNSNFCKSAGIKAPRLLIRRKIFFKKVLVNSPKTKKEVESLRICKIE